MANCELCGEPMPAGEEMFKFHGYSGNCPKPPLSMAQRKIVIQPSPTADTRTCDWSKVTKEQLFASSKQHIEDVGRGLSFFISMMAHARLNHDYDKLSGIDAFHADFQTGFKQTGWWDNHRKESRHHLNVADGIPADVNLIDIIKYVVDCVMAGMARSGSVYELKLPDEVLRRAFANTVELLKNKVVVSQVS